MGRPPSPIPCNPQIRVVRDSDADSGARPTIMNDYTNLSAPTALAGILAETAALGFGMVSEPLTGSLLRTLAAVKPDGDFLELGTGTGAATAWLLDGMDARSRLISVEND